jgi:succinate dehydrogenase/fumarate reductase iron-sulfur protein
LLSERYAGQTSILCKFSALLYVAFMPAIRVRVQRSAAAPGAAPRFEDHGIEAGDKASVLDALFLLQRGPCPDLAFRFSCRVGMCGSCSMVVNGRERLACSTLIQTVGHTLTLEPLRNLPVTRDLAVDLSPFFSAYKKVLPHFTPREDLNQDEFYRLPRNSAEWNAFDHQPQCIDCAACYSACTLVTLNPRYLGPMALHRALNLVLDPRQRSPAERLNLVTGESGAFRCHTLGNCRDVCPRGISPTHSIERLKRLAVMRWCGSFLGKVFRRKRPDGPATHH